MGMLDDRSLRATSQAFAAGVSRFGDLERAADLVESLSLSLGEDAPGL